MHVQPYDSEQLDAVVRFSLQAWAPVFDSIQKVMDFAVYREFFPDWCAHQQKAVEATCVADDTKVWVATDAGSIVGFVAVKFHSESNMGEIYMIAVDPDYQRQGIAQLSRSSPSIG